MTDDQTLLKSYRVLDLTDERGFLCGRILGDLGADVIKIERPGGDAARRLGPFYKNNVHPERSLHWYFYNANKRGITLNLNSRDGQAILKRMAARADIVIESFPPGYLDGLGIGYAGLSAVNPAVILTSISAFGQDGPYRDYKAPDIVGMSLGGYLYLCGDTDRAPLRLSVPQAYQHAASQAAVASLIAHYHRKKAGRGQHVDVSMQQCIVMLTTHGMGYWQFLRTILKREGRYRSGITGGTRVRHLWPCKDGFVCYYIAGGAQHARSMRTLVQWMDSEKLADEFVKGINWDTLDMATITQDLVDKVESNLAGFLLSRTKRELFEGGRERHIEIYPVSTFKDIKENPQLEFRKYYARVPHPELKEALTYPGSFVFASTTRNGIRFRAPLIGEHNREVFCGEMGFSEQKLAELVEAGVI